MEKLKIIEEKEDEYDTINILKCLICKIDVPNEKVHYLFFKIVKFANKGLRYY
jgi:hypothetical protein